MSNYHEPVLLQEVINAFQPIKGRNFIDATGGGGGHTTALLQNGGNTLTIDWDIDAITHIQTLTKSKSKEFLQERYDETIDAQIWKYSHLTLVRGNFRNIKNIAHACGFSRVSGVLFDLGVSSHQLDTGERGFSFQKNGPLDMRMDKRLAVKAEDLLHALTKKELIALLQRFGEERNAVRIANIIVEARRLQPIKTSDELAQVIKKNVWGNKEGIHPATKVFQALRIAVNDELGNISTALPQAYDLLDAKGKIVVISFHSLEDRIIKEAFLRFEREGKGKVILKKPITASEEELAVNKRSRSAKMRIFEKN